MIEQHFITIICNDLRPSFKKYVFPFPNPPKISGTEDSVSFFKIKEMNLRKYLAYWLNKTNVSPRISIIVIGSAPFSWGQSYQDTLIRSYKKSFGNVFYYEDSGTNDSNTVLQTP